jgi:phage portal protein BeeE
VAVSLLDRITARTIDRPTEQRYAIDQYINEYLLPTTFGFNGIQYGAGFGLTQTLAGNRATEITATLPGYLAALRSCPPAFAAQLVRALVLSQARFVFRNPPWHPSTPRKTFGTRALNLLERPWKNATTGELIARMEWHAGVAGNAYVTRSREINPATGESEPRLRVLRPDWVAILYGSDLEPEDPGHALDGRLLGYVYQNQGLFNSQYRAHTLLPADVAHWSPIPNAENAGIGESWITPAVREIQKDRIATQHTINYFANGATPNMVVSGIAAATREQFEEIVEMMEANHAGVANAYKTLYLAAGADARPVGANLADIDMKSVNGTAETRIASLSRVHPVILGIAEGLAGSSLNAGNFGMARRIWADSWIYPTLQDLAASLAPLVDVPADAELWTDVGDMPILREDAKDAAEINQIKMATAVAGVNGGFEAESVKAFVDSGDVRVLKHTNLVSVQLQQPGAERPQPASTDTTSPNRAAGVDVHPGYDQLHHYWTIGKGRGEWVGSPEPWTTLVALLIEHAHVSPGVAKTWASRWFIEVFGYAAGSDKNRVAHGRPPRGNVVGPG